MEELPENDALVAQPCAPVGFEHVWAMTNVTKEFFESEQHADGPIFSAFGYEWCLHVGCFEGGGCCDHGWHGAMVAPEQPSFDIGIWLVLLTSHAHVRVSLSFTLGHRVRHLREVALCTYSAEARAAEDVDGKVSDRAGFPYFVPCHLVKSCPEIYFPDGRMTVKVLLRACDVPRYSPVAVQLPQLSEQWRSLLASGRGADVTLFCEADDVKLAAHSVVLSVRSSVFAVKFSPGLGRLPRHTRT